MDNFLYAVDIENKRELWRFKTGKYGNGMTPLIHNNTIFCGSRDGIMYAVTLDGEEKWRFNAGSGIILKKPLWYDNSVIFGSESGYIYKIDPDTGKELWRFKSDGPVFDSVKVYNNMLYFCTWNGTLYSIDTHGKLVSSIKITSGPLSYLPPLYEEYEIVTKSKVHDIYEKEEAPYKFTSERSWGSYATTSPYVTKSHYTDKRHYK